MASCRESNPCRANHLPTWPEVEPVLKANWSHDALVWPQLAPNRLQCLNACSIPTSQPVSQSAINPPPTRRSTAARSIHLRTSDCRCRHLRLIATTVVLRPYTRNTETIPSKRTPAAVLPLNKRTAITERLFVVRLPTYEPR